MPDDEMIDHMLLFTSSKNVENIFKAIREATGRHMGTWNIHNCAVYYVFIFKNTDLYQYVMKYNATRDS